VISLTFDRLIMADDDGSVRTMAAVISCHAALVPCIGWKDCAL
jgi:hypothetical protein